MNYFEPNVVIVDDKRDEIQGIITYYQENGIGCKYYNADLSDGDDYPENKMSDVVFLFLDLFYSEHFDAELSISWVRSIIHPGAFYILILWTKDVSKKSIIEEQLEKMNLIPYCFIIQNKGDFVVSGSAKYDYTNLLMSIDKELKKISAICRKHNVSLVVDAISSFLSDDLDMEELNIDICITSSQKGLNIAPGLSFLFLSPRILQTDFLHKSYYFDFAENLKNLERGQTPYSPATSLFMQLHARLKENVVLGVDKIIASVRAKALYFRELCRQNGWEIPAEVPSNCITGFFVRQNGDILFNELLKQDIFIMPGGTPCYFRVSHLGVQSEEDLDDLAMRIKEIEYR